MAKVFLIAFCPNITTIQHIAMKTFLSTVALVLFITASVAAQDYDIKLGYTLNVNQRYKFTKIIDSSEQTITAAPKRTPDITRTESRIELESVVTVLEVDGQGHPAKESHEIAKLVQTKGKVKETVLSPGTKVIASKNGKGKVFEFDDKLPALDAEEVLGKMISLGLGGHELYGKLSSKTRRKIGETWDLESLKDMKEGLVGIKADPERLSGKVTLQNITNNGNGDVLHLLADVSVDIPPPPLRDGWTCDSLRMQTTISEGFPADATNPMKEDFHLTVVTTVVGTGRPDPIGPIFQRTTTNSVSTNYKIELLK